MAEAAKAVAKPEPYIWASLVRQIGQSAIEALTQATVGAAKVYSYTYASVWSKRADQVIKGFARNLYDPRRPIGRALRATYLPSRFHGGGPNDEAQVIAINAHAASRGVWQQAGMAFGNVSRVAGDVYALVRCAGDGCSAIDTVTVSVDTASAAANAAASASQFAGFKILAGDGQSSRGATFLHNARGLYLVGGVFRAGAGTTRLISELRRYRESGEINGSTILVSVTDVTAGASDVLYYATILQEAARITDQQARVGALANGIVRFSRLRVAGIAGLAAAGDIINIATQASIMRNGASEACFGRRCKRQMISGSLGVLSSTLFLGSNALFVPGWQVVGLLCYAGGMVVLIFQSVYDYLDRITPKAFIVSNDGTYVEPME